MEDGPSTGVLLTPVRGAYEVFGSWLQPRPLRLSGHVWDEIFEPHLLISEMKCRL